MRRKHEQSDVLSGNIDVKTPGNPSQDDRPTVIGIGASAGGLQALQAFFEALPADTGMSFVVIMHLSPEHESHLAELLQAKTTMPVQQVTERVSVAPNHIYVIPPNKRLEVTDFALATYDFDEPRGHRAPIDLFFRTMAAAYGDGAAIILSGGGTDGSVGVKAVKEGGGLVLVQAPEEAEFDSMPRAAIATGLVDIVLPVRELALRLVEVKQYPRSLPVDPDGLAELQADALRHILAQLRIRTGNDFSAYKPTTVLRRLQRRMQVTQKNELPEYLAYLRQHGKEAEALMKDLLIGVTNFFRDPEAFAALEKTVIPKLFAGKEAGDTVRVWVVGCSTGEEAYSMAILLAEHANTLEIRPEIQVFASDIDEDSLAIAREGLYPLVIRADVSEERLDRFFEKEGDHYRITREIRDSVLFAVHSVLRDPPFSKLDLVSCRNLLIYVQREFQGQVFDIFHYALRAEGYLFLGSAETTEGTSKLFRLLDMQHRLYQAKQRRGEMPFLPTLQHKTTPLAPTAQEKRLVQREPEMEETLHRRALEAEAPPSLLVDEDLHIVHLSERAGRYLQPSGGTFTNDITKLVRPELQGELHTALFQAFEKGTATVARPVAVQFNGTPHRVYLTVRPTKPGEEAERLALVIFNEDEAGVALPVEEGEPAASGSVAQLEEELRHVRDRLQITSEEYESSREQMKAQNEELLSINEEYKSTMEELETSKEELQSLNEELETINAELKHKVVEVSLAHSDLQNLMEATEIGTLFLDRELRIQRFTSHAESHFNLVASDRGRPLSHLTHRFDYGRIEADAGLVLTDLRVIEREIRDEDDRWFLARLRPYRTVGNQVDGVVLTFFDITELKRAEMALRAEKEYAQQIVDTVHEGVLVLDQALRVQSANSSFYRLFEVSPEDIEGRLVYELGNGQWNIPDLRGLLEEILPESTVIHDYEVIFEEIGPRVMRLNARQIEEKQLILLAIDEVTAQRQAQEALHQLNETLEARVAERTEEVRTLASKLTMAEQAERRRIAGILHDDLQQVLYGIQMKISLIHEEATAGEYEQVVGQAEEAAEWIEGAVDTTRRLAVDLSPPVLASEGLSDTISWLRTQLQDRHKLTLEVEAEHAFYIADADMRVLLFQVIRELLFNIVKHAGVDRARVEITDEEGHVVIRIIDEGHGFDVAEAEERVKREGGFGLFSVRERLALFGGRMEIDSAPGQGTRVTIHMPLASQPPASTDSSGSQDASPSY